MSIGKRFGHGGPTTNLKACRLGNAECADSNGPSLNGMAGDRASAK